MDYEYHMHKSRLFRMVIKVAAGVEILTTCLHNVYSEDSCDIHLST